MDTDTRFAKFVREFPGRLAMPLCSYAGLEITGESVEDMLSVPGSQFKAVMAMHERYGTPVLVTAIDPTAEAETYGCEVRLTEKEAPVVVGRLVTDAAGVAALSDPVPGDARTRVPIETAWRLTAEVGEGVPVLGAMLAPFALASQLFGAGEALAAAASDDPDAIEALLDIVTGFLCRYALEFRETGAWGVVVSEAAGRLAPEAMERFSVPFIKRIVKAVGTEDFAVIPHSCNATLGHLDGLLAGGPKIFHFGSSMDMAGALARVGEDVVLGGNLDATAVFRKGTPQAAGEATRALLEATRGRRNFFVSSGCDLPPGSPLANLNAFFRAVAEFNK